MNKEAFSLEAVSAAAAADTLRFLTCGSVDDGKSTLIGRLLYDSHLLMEDQIEDLKSDSAKHGTNGEEIDFALLVDGLEAERDLPTPRAVRLEPDLLGGGAAQDRADSAVARARRAKHP